MSFHHCSVSQLGYGSIGIGRRKMTGTVSLRREALPGVKTKRINDKGILQRESMHVNLLMMRPPYTTTTTSLKVSMFGINFHTYGLYLHSNV